AFRPGGDRADRQGTVAHPPPAYVERIKSTRRARHPSLAVGSPAAPNPKRLSGKPIVPASPSGRLYHIDFSLYLLAFRSLRSFRSESEKGFRRSESYAFCESSSRGGGLGNAVMDR